MYIYINIIDTKARLPQSLRCIGDWERQGITHALQEGAGGRDRGIAVLKHLHINIGDNNDVELFQRPYQCLCG